MDVGSRTKENYMELRMYTIRWIETHYRKEDNVEQVREDVSTDLCIVNLAGCLALEDFLVKEGNLNVSTMSLSDLECMSHSNYVLKLILVPLIDIEPKDVSSSDVLQY